MRKVFKSLVSFMLALILSTTFLSDTVIQNSGFVVISSAAENGKLNKSSLSLIVGEKSKLELNVSSNKIIWKSKDVKIATVSSNGTVTAKKEGSTVITATSGSKKYECKVFVKKYRINTESSYIKEGSKIQAELLGDTKGKKVNWSSSDKEIATVTTKGVIKGKSVGIVTITAKVDGDNYSKKIYVKLKKEKVTKSNKEQIISNIEKSIDYYENLIDYYEEQCEYYDDILEKCNDGINEAYRYIAQYQDKLDKAKNNRNQLVFTGSGYGYEPDYSAIKYYSGLIDDWETIRDGWQKNIDEANELKQECEQKIASYEYAVNEYEKWLDAIE